MITAPTDLLASSPLAGSVIANIHVSAQIVTASGNPIPSSQTKAARFLIGSALCSLAASCLYGRAGGAGRVRLDLKARPPT